jgi:hypothetical protein
LLDGAARGGGAAGRLNLGPRVPSHARGHEKTRRYDDPGPRADGRD